MRISEIPVQEVREYIGISDHDEDRTVKICCDAAKAFIIGYTGLTAEELDNHEDLTIAYLVIINDMYTNRDYSVQKNSLNPIAAQLLAMYSVNYL